MGSPTNTRKSVIPRWEMFSWVHMARPQPVCHTLCFLVGSHGKAPACMSRPVFSRGFTWQAHSLFVTPCVFTACMSRPVFSRGFTWQGPSLYVTPCGPVFSRGFTWQAHSLYVTPCVFSWVQMARPQPVCHALWLCFLVSSHGKAPACM